MLKRQPATGALPAGGAVWIPSTSSGCGGTRANVTWCTGRQYVPRPQMLTSVETKVRWRWAALSRLSASGLRSSPETSHLGGSRLHSRLSGRAVFRGASHLDHEEAHHRARGSERLARPGLAQCGEAVAGFGCIAFAAAWR
jgi:hypothetical protein